MVRHVRAKTNVSRPITYAGLKLEQELNERGIKLPSNVIDDIAKAVVLEFLRDAQDEGGVYHLDELIGLAETPR